MIDTLTASSFLTTEQYSKQQDTSMAVEEELGRDAFLTLLTTQLTNQSPLDPMDNEAFVAQLAQFSQVEGIKGMQTSLEDGLVVTIPIPRQYYHVQVLSSHMQDVLCTGAVNYSLR